jgi:uncharacterized RDD family membrane protein YckC
MKDQGQKESEGRESRVALELLPEEQFDKLHDSPKEEERASAIRWGGFFRRAVAFFVDGLVLSALSILLFCLGYVAYSVGLAAHHRSLSAKNLGVFLRILFFACIFLFSGYFVLLHGMEGKTVGKWLLGLRVVGSDQRPITYWRALCRWIAALASAPFGVGFLWILWSKEKRGWHDLLAGTWVIRESVKG